MVDLTIDEKLIWRPYHGNTLVNQHFGVVHRFVQYLSSIEWDPVDHGWKSHGNGLVVSQETGTACVEDTTEHVGFAACFDTAEECLDSFEDGFFI